MWGTLPSRPGPSLRDRFIPTHVGNTSPDPATHGQFAVHPHACGEHQRAVIAQHAADGSSPRMWGTRAGLARTGSGLRFIPTHVGNTTAALASVSPMNGSSPRMWGTHEHACKNIQIRRFIPTHVGNTWYPGLRASAPPVHPHACGEHFPGKDAQEYSDGSSPRMWGTPSRPAPASSCHRFIPTHVGNTMRSAMPRCGRAVHPHACGEHRSCIKRAKVRNGSSPRMWGTRLPAWCAGAPLAVHPHACGEHDAELVLMPEDAGSSPRMWGTHLPYSIVFKEEKTLRKIYRLILYSVVRSRGWNATNCSPSNNTGCRRLTPRVWNS
ncbi:hypothetical protein Q089_03800 [Pseudomonas aeruginosa C48]|nr:hypothetical protein Q089_03800 [Pseudomonas aeruginosa C48]